MWWNLVRQIRNDSLLAYWIWNHIKCCQVWAVKVLVRLTVCFIWYLYTLIERLTHFGPACSTSRTGIVQWLKCWTHDWKVTSSSPCRSGGRIFFSRVNFLCWLLFFCPFLPCVTAVARKRSRSFCQKCRWQVTAQTRIPLTYVALHEVTWRMVVWCTQNLRRDSCSFMWHQPYQHCKYTTSADI